MWLFYSCTLRSRSSRYFSLRFIGICYFKQEPKSKRVVMKEDFIDVHHITFFKQLQHFAYIILVNDLARIPHCLDNMPLPPMINATSKPTFLLSLSYDPHPTR